MQNLAQIGDGAGTPKLRNLVKIAVFGKTHLLIFLSPFPSLRLPLFPSHPSLSPSLHLFPFRQSMVAGYTHVASIAANRSLSVSLSALISQKPQVQISPNFLHMWRVSVVPLSALQCMHESGFVDDAMFSHNRANGPESNTTRSAYIYVL